MTLQPRVNAAGSDPDTYFKNLKMKRYGILIYSIVWMIFAPVFSSAQVIPGKYLLTGKLIDSLSGEPLGYATIILSDESENRLAAAYSGDDGSFNLTVTTPGIYMLHASSIGYGSRSIKTEIRQGQYAVHMGVLPLVQSAGSLQEVVVTGTARLVEQRAGMLIYHAENDLTNKGGTAADVLRKAPALSVDAGGNVTMRGSGNLKILINGKYSGQMARNPADALNMMSSDMIGSVEIITSPSAKYDAEGAAGVINIITKKGKRNIGGAVEMAASNRELVTNPRFSASGDKWNINANAHLHRLKMLSGSALERINLENAVPSLKFNQDISKNNIAPHGSASFSIDHNPDSLNEFSAAMTYWFGNFPDNNRQTGKLSHPGGVVYEQYSQEISSDNAYSGADISLGYTRKFRKPGHEIILLAQTSPFSDRSDYMTVQSDNNRVIYREKNDNAGDNGELTLQADHTYPFGSGKKFVLDGGVKMIRRDALSEYNVYTGIEDLSLNPERSDEFKYRQIVKAAYMQLKVNMKNNWSGQAGLRLENTYMKGKFLNSHTDFSSSFNNFVPSATVTKRINDTHSLELAYTRRLTRPYIWDLNPNANASDPKNIVQGNPELDPETAHQAELIYSLSSASGFFLNTAFFWRETDNSIEDLTVTDAAGISLTMKQNLAASRQYGLNISSSFSLGSNLAATGNINLNHLTFKSTALSILNDGWAVDMNLNTTYKFPRNYSFQAFGEFRTRRVTMQGYRTSGYYYSFAAKKELPGTRLSLILSAVNPFSEVIRQTDAINTGLFTSRTDNRYYDRAIKLTAGWEFGRSAGQKQRRKITNDDIEGQQKQ